MEWTLGNQISIRTLAIGCTVAVVCATVMTVRPTALPVHFSLPHISLGIGTASAADPSIITVTQADAASASAVVTSTDDVHSQEDVVAYADALMQADPRITQVRISGTSVSMTYQTADRILNVRTISAQTSAMVNEDGTVSISGSWMRPLFTHYAQASSPDAGFSDISLIHDSNGLAPSTEARLLARLHGRFQIGAIQ